jgi:hypothetical protein
MDIRVVESMGTAGSLSDSAFRINSNVENISLDYGYTSRDLGLLDNNLNYTALPWQLGTQLVKKTFLTYNGISCETGELIQTLVSESSDEDSLTQDPGYNNSNLWVYVPSEFNLPGQYPTTSNPLDTSTWPYDQSQGITVVKQFLGGESGLVPNLYKAFYRSPVQYSFQLANADGINIYTDGWYTSYVIACKTWIAATADVSAANGQIVFYPDQEKFYINITGATGSVVVDPDNSLLTIPDTTNWRETPTFVEWIDFLRNNMGPAMSGDPVYFVETQHLVTADLNTAIRSELLKLACCCESKDFGLSNVETWSKLTQKRIAALIKFNGEVFKSAQKIIESTRAVCYLCLYHDNEKLC